MLNREELLGLIKDEINLVDSIDMIKEKLNIVINYLESKEGAVNKYYPSIRAQFCKEEFENIIIKEVLSDRDYIQAFYDIYEVLESDKNNIYQSSFRGKEDSNYTYSIYISMEEKDIIIEMINKLYNRFN